MSDRRRPIENIKQDRSAIMRAVKGKHTGPERAVRTLLTEYGYRYRLHSKKVPGVPDIVFPGRKKVIFVHGCFWHGHHCKRGARIPKTNRAYWINKIARNKSRDVKNKRTLKSAGWAVLTIWECEIRKPGLLERKARKFLEAPGAAI